MATVDMMLANEQSKNDSIKKDKKKQSYTLDLDKGIVGKQGVVGAGKVAPGTGTGGTETVRGSNGMNLGAIGSAMGDGRASSKFQPEGRPAQEGQPSEPEPVAEEFGAALLD